MRNFQLEPSNTESKMSKILREFWQVTAILKLLTSAYKSHSLLVFFIRLLIDKSMAYYEFKTQISKTLLLYSFEKLCGLHRKRGDFLTWYPQTAREMGKMYSWRGLILWIHLFLINIVYLVTNFKPMRDVNFITKICHR